MKSYTDLEQSKKLAEILPLESADMWYHGHCSPWKSERKYDDEPCPFHSISPTWDKPCWSLAALLELTPNDVSLLHFEDAYQAVYDIEPYHITPKFNNPLDAAFEMVVWLKENKKL